MGRSRPLAPLRASFFGAVVTLTDLLPPRLRYGYVHRMTRAVFSRALPVVPRAVTRQPESVEARRAEAPDICCAILADHLDVGGIGTVVEMLAANFEAEGVRPVVICHGDGLRAQKLRQLGVDVRAVSDGVSAQSALASCGADVAQVHSAPEYLEKAAMASKLPLITVMHNTEIHYTARKWAAYRALLDHSIAGVAVSETVREYHARHVSPTTAQRMSVVPNGTPALSPPTTQERNAARAAVSKAAGSDLSTAVLFICLARYDSQKNVAGTTTTFTRAASRRDDIHLIFAGDPSDWAELRRAQALRDLTAGPHRIHYLGNSDAQTLLTAGDVFVLNSFFEGWPVAATEALAAGLPLVISEVGGAKELVARDPEFSVMVANPAGDAAGISDRAVRLARRRIRNQSGADVLEAALLSIAARTKSMPHPRSSSGAAAGISAMVHAHAQVLRDAVQTQASESSSPGLP
ncbi:glycosyltransferase family 4 protein [Salinibacterium sp. M195]|uniref:glycosyltransferase family 4 protein n=1 Tax=Salinibacterium sp. M195 TaxID=2583374 RepID=UPI001C62F1B1|nr:glycosyltransferase family 4 protein [Salinibacterium sp. M195]QYH36955.1 glycosyltransferase family 4 protein [Salinibacterium sp. M195]